MGSSKPWTSSDLELLPDDGKRYEIIDGQLYVSSPNHFRHQTACGDILCDRVVKLDLYSRRGITEYWIANWQERWIEVYRQDHGQLRLVDRLNEADTLESPLLPGFSCGVAELFGM